ncbi:MAG TPA: hypothetical protein VGR84_01490 [Candidatus Acidoferrales bacterium]|nr:hypothetical protein [Candidatus Acidoferrales bacterium]
MPQPPLQTTRVKSKAKVPAHFWKKVPRWIWVATVGFSVLITMAEGYPWLSIQTSGLLDPYNPYSELFQVSNGGYVPLTNLDCDCGVNFDSPHIHFQNDSFISDGFAKHLGHGGTATLPCFRVIRTSDVPSGAKLDIVVSYSFFRVNLHWLRRSQTFHFQSIRGDDGSQHWQFIS